METFKTQPLIFFRRSKNIKHCPTSSKYFLLETGTSKELVHITHQAIELANIHCHVQIWNNIKALSFFNVLQLPLQAFCCKSSAPNNKHYTGWSKRIKCLSDHLVDHLTLVENSRLSPGLKHFSPDEGTTINRALHNMCFWYGTHAARK